eukprot:jgi/Galph1/191/GphlegSOOS_G4896.1
MEAEKENIDSTDTFVNHQVPSQNEKSSRLRAFRLNRNKLSDEQREKESKKSAAQKRVSFGGSQVKIFERQYDEWDDEQEHKVQNSNSIAEEAEHSTVVKQEPDNDEKVNLASEVDETVIVPSLSALLKESEEETNEWNNTEIYSNIQIDDQFTYQDRGIYTEEDADTDDLTNTNASLSFFMDEDISRAAKLPRVSIGDTTVFMKGQKCTTAEELSISSQHESTEMKQNANNEREIEHVEPVETTEHIPNLSDLLKEDETISSNWESIAASMKKYQQSQDDGNLPDEDGDASFERMYGRVFGSPSKENSTRSPHQSKELTMEITKAIPSLRMLMEEDTTTSFARIPVSASDLKNIQRQIQMDETEETNYDNKESDEVGSFDTSRLPSLPAKEEQQFTSYDEDEDWSLSGLTFEQLKKGEQDNEHDTFYNIQESSRELTWPVSRPQTDTEEWSNRHTKDDDLTREDRTPRGRFMRKPPVYTPGRKVKTVSKDTAVLTQQNHLTSKPEEKHVMNNTTYPIVTPSPTVQPDSKDNRFQSSSTATKQERKQSLEYRRRSIAAHVKRLSNLPTSRTNMTDRTPNSNRRGFYRHASASKEDFFGDDDDTELHALTDIFANTGQDTEKNRSGSEGEQGSSNSIQDFLQEVKVRFLDNVSSRRRQTSHGVYTSEDSLQPETEEQKIVVATGSYEWLKSLEKLCGLLENSSMDLESLIVEREKSLDENPSELFRDVIDKKLSKQHLTRLQISMKRLKNFCRLEARCLWYEKRLSLESNIASSLEEWISCLSEEMEQFDSRIVELEALSREMDTLAEKEKLVLLSEEPSSEQQVALKAIIESLVEQESVREEFLLSIEFLKQEIESLDSTKQRIRQEGSSLSKRRYSLEQFVLSSSDASKSSAASIQETFELYCEILGFSINKIDGTTISFVLVDDLCIHLTFMDNNTIFCEVEQLTERRTFRLHPCISQLVTLITGSLQPQEFRAILWRIIYKLTCVNLLEKQVMTVERIHPLSIKQNGSRDLVIEGFVASSKLKTKLCVRCKCEDILNSAPFYWEVESQIGNYDSHTILKRLTNFVTDSCPVEHGWKHIREWFLENV